MTYVVFGLFHMGNPGYYRWRREYGGLKIDQAKRLKELERENARLKKLLAEAHLDKAMLQEVVSGRLQQCAALNF